MGKQYTYSTGWENIIVVVIHIYEVRAISIPYSNHEDTESESGEIEIM